MRTNISKFKNLKKSYFKSLLDFTDINFKKAHTVLIVNKITEEAKLKEIKNVLSKLKFLELLYLLNLYLQSKDYPDLDFVNFLFFDEEYEVFKDKLPDNLLLRFEFLKKQIIKESRQKKPLFKREIEFQAFLRENLNIVLGLHKGLQKSQFYGQKLMKEHIFFYMVSNNVRKALNVKIPNFKINKAKIKKNHELENQLEIFTIFWNETFPDLTNNLHEKVEYFQLNNAPVIFRDYFFNKRDALTIDAISKNYYLETFKKLDKMSKEGDDWKEDLCLYLYELCRSEYIITKSNDELIYFLSLIFNRYSKFSFSSIQQSIMDNRKYPKKNWIEIIKKHYETI